LKTVLHIMAAVSTVAKFTKRMTRDASVRGVMDE
jgi:hypothetical protein